MSTPAAVERGEIRFAMLLGRKAVSCFVTKEALEDIEGAIRMDNAKMIETFERHREQFESIVSSLWDAGHLPPRVTAEHVRG